MTPYSFSFDSGYGPLYFLFILAFLLLLVALILLSKARRIRNNFRETKKENPSFLKEHAGSLNSPQIKKVLRGRRSKKAALSLLLAGMLLPSSKLLAQEQGGAPGPLLSQAGIIITIVLLLVPILLAVLLLIVKLKKVFTQLQNKLNTEKADQLANYLSNLPEDEAAALTKRQKALDYRLSHQELSGDQLAEDKKGLLQINGAPGLPIVAVKKKRSSVPILIRNYQSWCSGTWAVLLSGYCLAPRLANILVLNSWLPMRIISVG